MAREFSRTDRVGQQIHKEIASILQNEFKNRDPRLGMVTVSSVEVSRDLAYTKIYVTFFENDEELMEEYLNILQENKGYIRTLLASRMRMRAVKLATRMLNGHVLLVVSLVKMILISQTRNNSWVESAKVGRSMAYYY
jgi:ribosome-binding factor A